MGLRKITGLPEREIDEIMEAVKDTLTINSLARK